MKTIKVIIILNFFFQSTNSLTAQDKIYTLKAQKEIDKHCIINFSIGFANIDAKAIKEFQQFIESKSGQYNVSLDLLKQINKNKFTISVISLVAIYVITLYKIIKINKIINSNETLSSFKSDVAFENLVLLDHKELLNEFLKFIQKKYCLSNNIEALSKLNILTQFSNDIDNELKVLESYVKFGNWINFLHIGLIFNLNTSYFKVAEDKINRLKYLKNIFSNASIHDFKQKEKQIISNVTSPAAA